MRIVTRLQRLFHCHQFVLRGGSQVVHEHVLQSGSALVYREVVRACRCGRHQTQRWVDYEQGVYPTSLRNAR